MAIAVNKAVFCAVAAGLLFCGRDRVEAAPAVAYRKLTVTPAVVALDDAGMTQRLVITATRADGRLEDVTTRVRFATSNPRVARVTVGGVASAAGDGAARVTASFGRLSAAAAVRVRNAGVERPVSFTNDVLPLLTREGCNNGMCHGKSGGQNGFRLSLLGFDAAADHAALVFEAGGRRVQRAAPERSLLLLKATGAVPHAGGIRVRRDSARYRLLRRWIGEGAAPSRADERRVTALEVFPASQEMGRAQSQQMLVTAVYSDGSRRDVTGEADFLSNEESIAAVSHAGRVQMTGATGEAAVMARYMGQVGVTRFIVPMESRLARYPTLAEHNFIDPLVYRKLRTLRMLPSPLASDSVFLRRAYLDIIGTLPTAEEAQAFLAECAEEVKSQKSKVKREDGVAPGPSGPSTLNPQPSTARSRLIDRLLARPEYADFWALKWADLLRNNSKIVTEKGAELFHDWIRQSLVENWPYDRFVRELLMASGRSHESGPVNFYRVTFEASDAPAELTNAVTQVFLGTRLECAQCHHHPYEKWSQDDFYGIAAFFGRLQGKRGLPEQDASLTYLPMDRKLEVKHPRTGRPVAPRVLGAAGSGQIAPVGVVDAPAPETGKRGGEERKARKGAPPSGAVAAPPSEEPRAALVAWMTAKENPFLARALVNRMWAHFMGRGIVEPVDDMRATNPPSNPELLDALATQFTESGYDPKQLIRAIVSSRTYQLAGEPNATNHADTRNFARMLPKRITAEVLLDAVSQVTSVPETFDKLPPGTRAIQVTNNHAKSYFLDVFGRPLRVSPCECERSQEANVAQALHLMNSPSIHDKISSDEGTVARLLAAGTSDGDLVEELYLTCLSRRPDADERRKAKAFLLARAAARRAATEDLLWALINTREFVFNH